MGTDALVDQNPRFWGEGRKPSGKILRLRGPIGNRWWSRAERWGIGRRFEDARTRPGRSWLGTGRPAVLVQIPAPRRGICREEELAGFILAEDPIRVLYSPLFRCLHPRTPVPCPLQPPSPAVELFRIVSPRAPSSLQWAVSHPHHLARLVYPIPALILKFIPSMVSDFPRVANRRENCTFSSCGDWTERMRLWQWSENGNGKKNAKVIAKHVAMPWVWKRVTWLRSRKIFLYF